MSVVPPSEARMAETSVLEPEPQLLCTSFGKHANLQTYSAKNSERRIIQSEAGMSRLSK